MASINKKKIALIEKYTQEKLRNKAMKFGVTLKSPETVFLSKDTKFGRKHYHSPLCCGWAKGKHWKQC